MAAGSPRRRGLNQKPRAIGGIYPHFENHLKFGSVLSRQRFGRTSSCRHFSIPRQDALQEGSSPSPGSTAMRRVSGRRRRASGATTCWFWASGQGGGSGLTRASSSCSGPRMNPNRLRETAAPWRRGRGARRRPGSYLLRCLGDCQVHKEVSEDGGEVRLYCRSEERAHKERGMSSASAGASSRGSPDSVSRPRAHKGIEKVRERIGRLKEQSRGVAQHYTIEVPDESGRKATALTWKRQPRQGLDAPIRGSTACVATRPTGTRRACGAPTPLSPTWKRCFAP